MLVTARILSRHASVALTYICLDAPLWGTHDVDVSRANFLSCFLVSYCTCYEIVGSRWAVM
jgi:hypothetical protein